MCTGALLVGCTIAEQPTATTAAINSADVIYTNGTIFTVNDKQQWAQAFAIDNGEFVAVGSTEDVLKLQGEQTNVIDLGGKLVMPGLIDAHIHLGSWYGAKMLEGKNLRFPQGASIATMQEMLVDYAAKNPQLAVITAENYTSTLFVNGEPNKSVLDEIIPDRPVVIISDTEHEAWLNSAALARVNITADTKDPQNGTIIRDPKTGEPSGTLREAAAGLWGWAEMPTLTLEQEVNGLKELLPYLNSLGLTSLKVQHAQLQEAQALKVLDDNNELSMRFSLGWTLLSPLEVKTEETLREIIANRGDFNSDLINPDFIKINIDGTPTGTAFLFEPYEGTDSYGDVFVAEDQLADYIAEYDVLGLGATFHVMGDAGVHRVINAIEAVKKRNGSLKARHQIAHSTMIKAEDLQRIVDLGIVAEFSPPDLIFDHPASSIVEGAIGAKRMEQYSPMKQLVDLGGKAVIASDGPLFWSPPLAVLAKMSRRVYPDGKTMSMAQVVKSMTLDAAYILNNDKAVGSIESGKHADFIVVDRNIFEIKAEEAAKAEVLQTFIGGESVYQKAQ